MADGQSHERNVDWPGSVGMTVWAVVVGTSPSIGMLEVAAVGSGVGLPAALFYFLFEGWLLLLPFAML